MKRAKIGALFLVSLLALAGVGVGYASWTDTLWIDGFYSTGSVGWKITDNSATYVWKVYDCDGCDGPDHEILVDYNSKSWTEAVNYVKTLYYPCCKIQYAAAAETAIVDDHTGKIMIDNLFPDLEFIADFTIEYFGTIPGKIYDITTSGYLNWLDPYANWYLTVTTTRKPYPGAPANEWITTTTTYNLEQLYGVQLHKGDEIHLELKINFPEEPLEFMGIERHDFDVYIDIMQWNNFPNP